MRTLSATRTRRLWPKSQAPVAYPGESPDEAPGQDPDQRDQQLVAHPGHADDRPAALELVERGPHHVRRREPGESGAPPGVFPHPLMELGVREPRTERLDPYPGPAELGRQPFRKGGEVRLGGAVVHVAGRINERGDRRDVEDAAAPTREESR